LAITRHPRDDTFFSPRYCQNPSTICQISSAAASKSVAFRPCAAGLSTTQGPEPGPRGSAELRLLSSSVFVAIGWTEVKV